MKELNWMVRRAKRLITLVYMVATIAAGSAVMPVVATFGVAGIVEVASAQADYYVDATFGSDSNDGESWGTAFETLQKALDEAVGGPAIIWVTEGTYTPTKETVANDPQSVTFLIHEDLNGVAIYGGFPAGGGANDQLTARNPLVYETILDGFLAPPGGSTGSEQNCPNANGGDCLTETPNVPGCNFGPCCTAVCAIEPFCCAVEWDEACVAHAMTFHGTCTELRARHVVTAIGVEDPSTILNGFTITGGFDDFGGTDVRGAGMYIRNSQSVQSNPTIVLCTFVDNHAAEAGGAVHVKGQPGPGANPTFIDCKFLGNTAVSHAGAMCNEAGNVTLINCLFSGNECGGNGGALFNSFAQAGTSTATLVNCTFSLNRAINGGVGFNGNGGGVFNASDATLTNCILWGNEDDSGVTEVASSSRTKSAATRRSLTVVSKTLMSTPATITSAPTRSSLTTTASTTPSARLTTTCAWNTTHQALTRRTTRLFLMMRSTWTMTARIRNQRPSLTAGNGSTRPAERRTAGRSSLAVTAIA